MTKIDIDISKAAEKLSDENMRRGQFVMANQMLSDMNDFVPADQYTLRQTGHVGPDGKSLEWRTPYARAQYYGGNGRAVFMNYTTPGTGPRWDLKAKGLFMSDWIEVFKRGANL